MSVLWVSMVINICLYVPGCHDVSVQYADCDIQGSPYAVEVYDPSQVRVGTLPQGIQGQPVRVEGKLPWGQWWNFLLLYFLKLKLTVTQICFVLIHPSCKTITKTLIFFFFFFCWTRLQARVWFELGPSTVSKISKAIYVECLYCFCHWGCWDHRWPLGLYFGPLLAILQCNKRQGLCLLQTSNTHAPYTCSANSMVMSYMKELPWSWRPK